MSCGMVRKVDELGRVVIPKEMRRILNIKTGSSIEMNINDNEEVVLKKFSEIENISFYASNIAELIYDNFNLPCLVCDEDRVVVCKGINKKSYLDKKIILPQDDIKNYIFNSTSLVENIDKNVDNYNLQSYIFPIRSEGVNCGFIVLLTEEKLDEIVIENVLILSKFLGTLLKF